MNKPKPISLKPIGDRLVIKPKEAEGKTASGIIIPDTAQKAPQRGFVVACGPGTKDNPMPIQDGDEVLYGAYAGSEIAFEGEQYLIMRENDIYAVL